MFNKNRKALIYRTLTRVLAISLLLNTTILGQNKPVISESLNLMTWDNTIEESPNTRYLSHDEKTILIQNFDSTNHLNWEIIKLDSSLYQFSQYTKSKKTRLLHRRGYLIINPSFVKIDTSISFDEKKFNEVLLIHYTKELIKHGYWLEKEDGYLYSGIYSSGKKEGKWSAQKYTPEKEIEELYEITNKDGIEISRINNNFAINPQADILRKKIIGKWYFLSKMKKIYFLKEHIIGSLVEFKENGHLKMKRCGTGDISPTTWSISPTNHLIIQYSKSSIIEYEFKKFTPLEIRLEEIPE